MSVQIRTWFLVNLKTVVGRNPPHLELELIYDFVVIQIRHIWYEMMLAFIRDQTFMIWMTKSKYKLKFHMGWIPPHHGF